MSSQRLEIHTLSLEECSAVHDWLFQLFRSHGITGDELDHAISNSFRPAIQSIDEHRLAKERRKLRVIDGGKE